MIITDRLKQLIFKHLYKELGNCEIIPYNNSIWFINRDNKHWYFEFDKDGTLYWRYSFFPSFFTIFSLERDDFEPILTSWVEEVLNYKVSTTHRAYYHSQFKVEEVLNYKVSTTMCTFLQLKLEVEEVLNYKVCATDVEMSVMNYVMEQALNQ